MLSILIIIPAYNEVQNIEKVMEHLKHTCPQYDYVIINDGSTDGTKEICEKKQYHVIHHPVNRGLTAAMQTGMTYAMEKGYDMALQFDADGQHLPEYIEEMVTCMEETNCDIVIASRFYGMKMPIRLRSVGGKMISAAIRMTTGKSLTDPTSGMRLYNKDIINILLENRKFAPEPDTIAYLIRMGADVREVKVEMEERKNGKSYLTPINAIKYMVRVLLSIFIFQWSWDQKKVVNSTGALGGIQQPDINRTA